jgi:hypothetical protein
MSDEKIFDEQGKSIPFCYLEHKMNISNLVFYNEVNYLEFVQKVGDMDITHLIDYKKRDLFLRKHGKNLFKNIKERKQRKQKKLFIEIRHETKILTQEEIDSLLTVVGEKIKLFYKIKNKIKWFYRDCSEWRIVIYKNNIYYKFGLSGIEKIDYNTKIINNKSKARGVLSQEEIDMLLTPIKKEKK